MNNKSIIFIILLIIVTKTVISQGISVNDAGALPDTSAMLDISSTSKGLLVPRMTEAQRNAIVLPATALMIFQTDGTSGFYYNAGTPAAPSWQLIGGLSSPNPNQPDVITTTTVTDVAVTSATTGGNVISDGGSAVTSRGVCYSTSPTPTTSDSVENCGTGTGSFIANLTDLIPYSTYYVRAFATNGNGTTYGDEVSFITPPLQVGDSYGGGIIFYMSGPNSGLISATADAPAPNYEWGCYTGSGGSGATGTTIGTGLSNTNAGCLYATTAAYYCLNLVQSGYSDWFLPSRDELLLMYQQRNLIGGFQVATYWTSTISGANVNFFAEYVDFTNGSTNYTYKNSYYRVRPIRAF